MENFRVAVESFIVKDRKALVIKRRPDDVHMPSKWDVPGGRLEIGENPLEGMKREAKEEIGINIDIIMPVDIQHFTREDGQVITMILFLCKPLPGDIKLSEEHTEYKWLDMSISRNEFPDWLDPVIDRIYKYKLHES
jgi:mutator protein MutT